APRDRSDPRPGGAGGLCHSPVLEEARREADPQGAEVGGGERRAARAARERGARRGPAARQVRGGERGADPEAVHTGRDGPGDAGHEADQPRGDPRGGRGGDPGAPSPVREGGGCESRGHGPARQGRGCEGHASQGKEGREVQEEESEIKWARKYIPTGSGSGSSSRGARG